MSLKQPRPLKPKDSVAIVAPSGVVPRDAFEKGLSLLAQRYTPVFTERIFAAHRYLAGDDEARLQELQAAIDDESIAAIWAARGGYGSMRLLSRLRWSKPKWLVGFSDITALHVSLQKLGWSSVHGPVVTQLGRQPASVMEHLASLLEGQLAPALKGNRAITAGVAEGRLLGGNLSVLTSLVGTPWMPDFRGAIVLLEDVGERPYRIDRMLTHLSLAGVFEGIAGLALGEWTDCEEKGAAYSSTDVLAEWAARFQVPCVGGFPIGHGAVNEPVVLGARVRLDANAKTLAMLP